MFKASGFIAILLMTVMMPSHSISLSSSRNRGFLSSHPAFVKRSSRNKSSFLWKIKSIPPAFLFGTIHVPYTRVWDAVPTNAKLAFKNANKVMFELDLTDHATLVDLSSCQMLPPGQHISQLIPTELYHRIQYHFENVQKELPKWLSQDQLRRGIDADYLFSTMTENWERKRPVWVMLLVNSLTKRDVASRGIPVLDLFLAKIAKRMGKNVGAVETVKEQCEPLNNFKSSHVIFALNQSLIHQENVRLGITSSGHGLTSIEDIITQYRNGDFDPDTFNQDTFQVPALRPGDPELTPEERQIAKELDKYIMENLIELRNKRIAARIVNLLVNQPDFYFFAFGAGHFEGSQSIIDFVKATGFQVEQVGPHDNITFSGYGGGGNRVQGTFEDLSDEEKTKAFLQFLQYRQQLERNASKENGYSQNLSYKVDHSSTQHTLAPDEKSVEKSLKIWYGLNVNASTSISIPSTKHLLLIMFFMLYGVLA